MDEQKDKVDNTELEAVNFSDAEVLEEAYTPELAADNARS